MSSAGPIAAPTARVVTVAININGTLLPGPVDFRVVNTTYRGPDTFEATLALADMPEGYGAKFWSDTDDITAEIFAGTGTDAQPQLTSLIFGDVDHVHIDEPANIVQINGRDRAARLMEDRATYRWQNKKSSDIVGQIADYYGLAGNISDTQDFVGNYYDGQYVFSLRAQSSWDVVTELARLEGYDAYVDGDGLNFQPKGEGDDTVFTVQYTPPTADQIASGNFVKLRMKRSLQVAGAVSAEVRSWNTEKGEGVYSTTTSTPTGSSSGETTKYLYFEPVLTQEQADQTSQQRAEEIVQHEREVELDDLPGDETVVAQQQLSLSGTGTAFDQTYFIDEVDRRYSFRAGFSMRIKAKNTSPRETSTS